jgi:hypothetical protein
MSEMFIAPLGITAFGGHKDRTPSKHAVVRALSSTSKMPAHIIDRHRRPGRIH